MLDRLTSLDVFVRVATGGSLSAAGRGMGLSQSMVTKHLASLEARLGVSLFHRTTRRLSITDAGRNYLESAERILADYDAANSSVAADRFEPRGMLRLNAPVSFGTRHIAPLLAEFSRRHPKLQVELGLNDRFVDLAEEGWDLAVRIGHLADSSLIARRLASCRTALAAAPSYLNAHGTPKTVADLAQHNCLGYTLSRTTSVDCWSFGAAAEVIDMDEEIDAAFSAVLRQLISYMMEDPRTISPALEIVFIAKSIERIGDHAKNIAEAVVQLVMGKDVRHASAEQIRAEVAEE